MRLVNFTCQIAVKALHRLLLGCTGLGTLGSVLGTTLRTVFHTGGVECATHDMVANTGEVFYTTATHKHNAVFLKV